MNSNENKEKQELQRINQATEQSRAPETLEIEVVGDQGALVPVQQEGQIVPVMPKHLTAEMDQTVGEKANAFLEMVRTDPTNYKLGDVIFNLGNTAMDITNIQIDLYNQSMGDVLQDVTGESPIFRDILDLKTNLDLINPAALAKKNIPEKVGWLFKKTVHRLPKGDEILRIIAENKETVGSTIAGLRNVLREHGDQVVQDVVELGIICDALKEAQLPLQEDIYLGQLQWKMISEFLQTMPDGMEKENVGYLLADLAAATVSLQEVDNLNLQTRYGGALVIRNSQNVRRVIRSTNILIGSVAAALAVRAAAAKQVQVQKMAKAIQTSVHDTMVDTSEKVGQAIVTGAEMNQQMMVNIDSLQKSCNNFDIAAGRLTEICGETVKIATLASNTMNNMNEKLRSRADAADSMRAPTSKSQ
ncbi:toxic anion resistance protein [Candidatus Pacearchaeota archaeon]|nr:toxic anion resistance protein [Candidatus Pacearchaeota archaeon]